MVSRSRKMDSKDLVKLQKEEKNRNSARRKAQKIGKSIATDKSNPRTKKPTRPARKITKKRSSVR